MRAHWLPVLEELLGEGASEETEPHPPRSLSTGLRPVRGGRVAVAGSE